jgi:hypothetical protein
MRRRTKSAGVCIRVHPWSGNDPPELNRWRRHRLLQFCADRQNAPPVRSGSQQWWDRRPFGEQENECITKEWEEIQQEYWNHLCPNRTFLSAATPLQCAVGEWERTHPEPDPDRDRFNWLLWKQQRADISRDWGEADYYSRELHLQFGAACADLVFAAAACSRPQVADRAWRPPTQQTNPLGAFKPPCPTLSPVGRPFCWPANNPTSLWGTSADDIEQILGEGWIKGNYRVTGEGWRFTKGDETVFYHTGGLHRGQYWGYTSGTWGKVKIVGCDYIPTPNDKARVLNIILNMPD